MGCSCERSMNVQRRLISLLGTGPTARQWGPRGARACVLYELTTKPHDSSLHGSLGGRHAVIMLGVAQGQSWCGSFELPQPCSLQVLPLTSLVVSLWCLVSPYLRAKTFLFNGKE
jgi:hypothetical protein